ncbi:MAG: glutathione synthase [Rhodospirillales bacterium]|jgi:glutathione synthase|nr:glutathione synthase [Rhodospirillales bacterium]MBT4005602.1 glutathione synthase [Rhodospirillales bacterium]MBT5076078.1 glutathione synthase [Rhodospirillales bacterium]MBT5112321.1 glutathione synthase [Rhodospirillales bacterium]MBT5672022.1 glutathione synthase [Rhodospirillales bacterium]
MSLAVAFQMDPLEGVDVAADSTYMLAVEACARKHALYHYLPQEMSLTQGKVTAKARRFEVSHDKEAPFIVGPEETIDLATLDVILMRQDPPFDMAYITATHILEHIHPQTLVVNDPIHVRNAPEKLFVTHFSDLMPETLISSDREQILKFREAYEDIIVKPLYGNGGAGVFHIKPGDENLNALLEMFTELYREPIVIQRYMPEVRDGDKRIILVDGIPAGAVNRVPAAGEARANLHVGGRAEKSPLTARDKEICAAIGPSLYEMGFVFVGIDVIGDTLTEINVTSPTGIQEINRFDGVQIESQIWDAIEARINARKA